MADPNLFYNLGLRLKGVLLFRRDTAAEIAREKPIYQAFIVLGLAMILNFLVIFANKYWLFSAYKREFPASTIYATFNDYFFSKFLYIDILLPLIIFLVFLIPFIFTKLFGSMGEFLSYFCFICYWTLLFVLVRSTSLLYLVSYNTNNFFFLFIGFILGIVLFVLMLVSLFVGVSEVMQISKFLVFLSILVTFILIIVVVWAYLVNAFRMPQGGGFREI